MEKCDEEFSATLDSNRRITIPKWLVELYDLELGKTILHITVRGISRISNNNSDDPAKPTAAKPLVASEAEVESLK